MTECALFEQLLPEIRIIIVRFMPTACAVMCYARTSRRAFRDVLEALPLDVFDFSKIYTEIGPFFEIKVIGAPDLPPPNEIVWKHIEFRQPHYTTHWLFREEKEEGATNNDID